MSTIKPGVATGDQVQEIFKLAKQKQCALPAVNVIGSSEKKSVGLESNIFHVIPNSFRFVPVVVQPTSYIYGVDAYSDDIFV